MSTNYMTQKPDRSRWETVRSVIETSIRNNPVIWVLGSLLLLRMGFIALSPVDLIADESYYWDWSRRLDYGYYSKPPMIAWINWLSTAILGASEFAVRFPAALFGTLGLFWIFLLGARLFSYRVGLMSVVLLALTPGQTAMSFLMTIDAPFLFFWAASLYGFWRMIQDGSTWHWSVLTACMLGLGLLSKQTMLGFYPLAGLFLILTPEYRPKLYSVKLWLTAGVSFVFLAPVLIWNMRNDWITLEHTASHFSEHAVLLSTRLARFAEFGIGQIGVVSPVLWFAIAVCLIAAARQFHRLSAAERYLFCYSAVPLAAIFVLSATRRLEPNWPAACYPAAVILTTATLLGRSNISDAISNRATWLSRSWKAGLICTLATYAAITVVPVSPLAGSPIDITCRLRGWSELANRFESLTSSRFTNHSSPPVIITTAGRDITSALAFYLPGQPLVPFWSQDDAGIQCQYDLWEKPELKEIPAAIIVTEKNPTLPNSLSQQFNDWNSLGTIAVDLGGGRKREYEVLQASRSAEKLPTDKERMAEKPQQTIVQ